MTACGGIDGCTRHAFLHQLVDLRALISHLAHGLSAQTSFFKVRGKFFQPHLLSTLAQCRGIISSTSAPDNFSFWDVIQCLQSMLSSQDSRTTVAIFTLDPSQADSMKAQTLYDCNITTISDHTTLPTIKIIVPLSGLLADWRS
jgi:hypothetical protein